MIGTDNRSAGGRDFRFECADRGYDPFSAENRLFIRSCSEQQGRSPLHTPHRRALNVVSMALSAEQQALNVVSMALNVVSMALNTV